MGLHFRENEGFDLVKVANTNHILIVRCQVFFEFGVELQQKMVIMPLDKFSFLYATAEKS